MIKFFCPAKFISQPTTVFSIIFLFVYYATSCFSAPLSTKEREWLKQHDGKITFALETNYAPFAFVDKNGKSIGLATDYLKLIQKKMGFSLQEIQFDSLNNIIESAKKNEVDIVNAVTETANRSDYLLFTKPFIEIPNVIIVRKENFESLTINKLKKLKISTVKNYAVTEYLSKDYSYLDIDLVPDDLTALLSVSFNRTDCAILDLATASYLIEQKGITNLRVSGDVGYNIKLSIASRKDWPILNQILNKGLAAISENEHESIRNKWISINQINLLKNRTFWGIIISITLVFLFCFLVVLIWNRTLKKQVLRRTTQLTSELEERKKVEKALEQSYLQLQAMYNTLPVIVWALDAKGIFTLSEGKDLATIGLEPGQVDGQSMFDVYKNNTRLIDAVNRGLSGEYCETEIEIKDNIFHTAVTPILNDDRTISGIYGLSINVTEKIRLKEMMVQSEKMLSIGGLAAGMAHEINNPLTGMIQSANVMKSRLENIDMQANLNVAIELGISMEDIKSFMEKRGIFRMIDAIQESGLRAAEIVSSMLSFARKSDANISSHRPVQLMDKTLELAATDYDFKSIKIIKEYADNMPLLPCEGAKIQQVLLNILRNGAQAMQEVKTDTPQFIIRIYTEKKSDMVCLEIKDNGPGMDEETCAKVFDPFFTTKPVGIGTGLGLSVSYFIVTENHKGTMEVISELGKGATFIVRLPIKR